MLRSGPRSQAMSQVRRCVFLPALVRVEMASKSNLCYVQVPVRVRCTPASRATTTILALRSGESTVSTHGQTHLRVSSTGLFALLRG